MSPHALHRRAALLVTGACALLAGAAPAVHASPVHQVAPGESLWQVAAANGLSPSALAAANGLSADAAVQAGQALTIPPQGAAPVAGAATSGTAGATAAAPTSAAGGSGSGGGIVVQPGDTLTAIAARQGVSVTRLAALNGLSAAALLPAGARLALPPQGSGDGGGSASSSSAGAAPSPAPSGPTTTASASATTASPAAGSGAGTAPASGTRVTATDVGSVAAQNGVPASLARAIAWQESGFNNGAVSSVGARGVMQVMPGTWDWIGSNLTSSPLDPSSATDNVRAGTLYLGHLLRQTGGDADLAAAAYYQGLSSVRSRGMYDDTKRYVQSVRALRSRFGG